MVGYHSKQRWWFPIGSLSIVTNVLTTLPQFAIECLLRSNQQAVGHFGAKFGEERVDRCKPHFNTICERRGAVVYKRNRVNIFCCLSTAQCTIVRQTNHGMVTSIAVGEIAGQ